MVNTFYNCISLKELDLSSFNTRQVFNMNYMFAKCSNLTKLNLESFSTQNCFQYYSTFEECDNLEITLNSKNCRNLMGNIPENIKIIDIS